MEGRTDITSTRGSTAPDAYMALRADALALLARITEAIENHDTTPAGDDLHWGHVGDMALTRHDLQIISDRLFAEGEYAPENPIEKE